MSEYAEKISCLLEKSKQLQLKQERLIEKRRNEVGDMALKYNIITLSDAILSGAFLEIFQSIKMNQSQIKKWEAAGMQHLKFSKSRNKSCSTNNMESGNSIQGEQKNHDA